MDPKPFRRHARLRTARRTLEIAAALTTLCVLPARAAKVGLDLPAPNVTVLTSEEIEQARFEAQIDFPLTGDWEANEKSGRADGLDGPAGSGNDPHLSGDRPAGGDPSTGGGTSPDDDSCHYARGNTMIIHVFIDHLSGSWSQAERSAAGAKAQTAKEWYVDVAPSAANLSFDSFETASFHWYNPSIAMDIPEDGMNDTIIAAAIAALGVSDEDGDGSTFDDFTLLFQDFAGGWDNVIAVFQPADVTGRAFAKYSWGITVQYTDDTANTWRHEWGHSFGACDEYEENGECNGGIDCGPCQSWYLNQVYNNSNCALSSCPSDVSCVMRNNVEAMCSYTRNHWGWRDTDVNGQLDPVKRQDSIVDWDWIYELWHGGWALTNETADSWVMAPRWKNWAVVGVRNPSDADYDFEVYNDNNFNYLRTSSTADGSVVDLVAIDYNHAELGNEHIQVEHDSGATSNYRIGWESGPHFLYPNGLTTLEDWNAGDVVRVWDVPLFAGESVVFKVDPGSNLDIGIMLFDSNGTRFFGNRTDAEWVADLFGGGGEESYFFTAETDDVYGFVVYANNAVTTNIGIQIGPAPTLLFAEQPVLEDDPLHLFTLVNSQDWFAAGARLGSGVDDVSFEVYDDYTYGNELVHADDDDGVELAVGLRPPGNGPALVRAHKEGSGFADYRMEYDVEDGPMSGYRADVWESEEVVRIFPVALEQSETYFFRQTQPTNPNTGFDSALCLFRASAPEQYFYKAQRSAGGNLHTAAEGGEWFVYQNVNGGNHALAMTSEIPVDSFYELWWGPLVQVPADEIQVSSNRVVFTESVPTPGWSIAAARPIFADGDVDVFLMEDDTYGTPRASSFIHQNANFCVARRDRGANLTIYPRFRSTDSRAFDWEWQGVDADFDLVSSSVTADRTWEDSEVVEMFTITIPVPEGTERSISYEVEPTSGSMDLGMMLYEGHVNEFYGRWVDGDKIGSSHGAGGSESIQSTYTDTTEVMVVVFNENNENGTYTFRVLDTATSDAAELEAGIPERGSLELLSAHPVRGHADFRLSLPSTGRVDVAVFDAGGRRIATLVRTEMAAGRHAVAWDGRDDRGESAPQGVYFAKAQWPTGRESVRVVKLE
ncbi:MAG: hypothetical protein KDA27_18185 [Candidatus Eisenbacteria bacterium]|uniref:FlgD/Vpr Ig-like domain-containing protein n=1 Tax=Eiseniibacteriota bacterium TaxID=2212470 RepID=A0A956NF46_UNCEI|nr:hypothetical protein [Candidatus Eisenbacteria bacterium]